MRILVTGFEPFGNDTINPSWEAVKELPDQLNECEIKKLCPPVVFGKAADIIIREATLFSPDAIICTGLAANRDAVTPEQVAINLCYGRIPDNEGNQPDYMPVIPDGPDGIFSTLPVRAITEAIRQAGIPAAISYTAGTYVCNDTLYRILYHYRNSPVKAGFIHLPALPEMKEDGKGLPLSVLTNALTEAIRALLKAMKEETYAV